MKKILFTVLALWAAHQTALGMDADVPIEDLLGDRRHAHAWTAWEADLFSHGISSLLGLDASDEDSSGSDDDSEEEEDEEDVPIAETRSAQFYAGAITAYMADIPRPTNQTPGPLIALFSSHQERLEREREQPTRSTVELYRDLTRLSSLVHSPASKMALSKFRRLVTEVVSVSMCRKLGHYSPAVFFTAHYTKGTGHFAGYNLETVSPQRRWAKFEMDSLPESQVRKMYVHDVSLLTSCVVKELRRRKAEQLPHVDTHI